MEKINFNLDAHSSLIIADGSIVEINGQKVLLTLVKDAQAPEPKKIDLHKDSWAVLNDGSQRFKDTVVRWLNENKNSNHNGRSEGYCYGLDKDGDAMALDAKYFTHILTLDEFCAIAYPETSEAGSELVGKSVRCVDGYNHIFTTDKWYQCVKPIHQEQAFSTNHEGEHDGFQGNNHNRFDLYNPLDYNPETLIGKYLRGHEITSLEIHATNGYPIFRTKESNGNYWIACKDITPSDVTDTPPLPSLKYEDCFERVKPIYWIDSEGEICDSCGSRPDAVPTEKLAKQTIAGVKLATILIQANGREWIPKKGENACYPYYDVEANAVHFEITDTIRNPFAFFTMNIARRAYEANKEIFHDYFGINE